jgi:hypothetical protein
MDVSERLGNTRRRLELQTQAARRATAALQSERTHSAKTAAQKGARLASLQTRCGELEAQVAAAALCRRVFRTLFLRHARSTGGALVVDAAVHFTSDTRPDVHASGSAAGREAALAVAEAALVQSEAARRVLEAELAASQAETAQLRAALVAQLQRECDTVTESVTRTGSEALALVAAADSLSHMRPGACAVVQARSPASPTSFDAPLTMWANAAWVAQEHSRSADTACSEGGAGVLLKQVQLGTLAPASPAVAAAVPPSQRSSSPDTDSSRDGGQRCEEPSVATLSVGRDAVRATLWRAAFRCCREERCTAQQQAVSASEAAAAAEAALVDVRLRLAAMLAAHMRLSGEAEALRIRCAELAMELGPARSKARTLWDVHAALRDQLAAERKRGTALEAVAGQLVVKLAMCRAVRSVLSAASSEPGGSAAASVASEGHEGAAGPGLAPTAAAPVRAPDVRIPPLASAVLLAVGSLDRHSPREPPSPETLRLYANPVYSCAAPLVSGPPAMGPEARDGMPGQGVSRERELLVPVGHPKPKSSIKKLLRKLSARLRQPS